MPEQTMTGRVLIVDDDPQVLQTFERVLRRAGLEVDTAPDGVTAEAFLEHGGYDAILSDIGMPRMNGIEFLRAVRAHDLDVPVLLCTGAPSIETATRAIELGAHRYLLKPVAVEDLRTAVTQAVNVHRLGRLKREALAHLADDGYGIGDLAGLEVRLISALKSLWMAYQPVVSWPDRRVVGFEALVRSKEPALPHPGALFNAAERLGWVHELGRVIRDHIGRVVSSLPADAEMLVNLHTHDLLDETLYSGDSVLTRYASRVILEITERASLDDVKDVRTRVARLREHGFRIAIDDLGAGYAGLNSFAQLEPDIVKLDMSLIRNVHQEPIKRRIVSSFTSLCGDLGMKVIAEGVEVVEERDAVLSCGCELFQGYLFARPGPAFPEVTL